MLDITLLRKDLDSVIARLQTRKNPQVFLDVTAFTALESERKTLQTRTEELQSQRNSLSKQIGQRKAKGESWTTSWQPWLRPKPSWMVLRFAWR
jgi:seryl-tRNA synthetase